MCEKRQKKRIKPASEARAKSEALSRGASGGLETHKTTSDTKHLPVAEQQLMEEILDKENLKQAVKRIMQNKGAAGVDGMTVDKLPAYLAANWKTLRQELLQGTYAPRAVRRVEIPKPTGGVRQLGIPSVVDRLHPASVTTSSTKALGWTVFPVQLRLPHRQIATSGSQASAGVCKQRIAICR